MPCAPSRRGYDAGLSRVMQPTARCDATPLFPLDIPDFMRPRPKRAGLGWRPLFRTRARGRSRFADGERATDPAGVLRGQFTRGSGPARIKRTRNHPACFCVGTPTVEQSASRSWRRAETRRFHSGASGEAANQSVYGIDRKCLCSRLAERSNSGRVSPIHASHLKRACYGNWRSI